MNALIKQNATEIPLTFLLVSSSDGVTAVTGASPTATISKNGAVFASPAGSVSEIGNGWYAIIANATDSNTLGELIVHATAAGAMPTDTTFQVVAFDPQDVQRLGLTALPATGAAAAPGAQMDLVNSPNATAVSAIQSGLSKPSVAQTITPADTTAAQTAQTSIASFTANGVALASSQPHYAPAIAGAQMDLVNSPNASAIAAIQSGLSKPGVAQTITPVDTTAAQTAQTSIANFAATGVVLASTQPHYAPAIAGAQMDLINSPNAAALAAIAAALLDLAGGVENSLTVRQAMRGITAVLLGKSADDGTTFRDVNDTTNRVTAALDTNGDRSTVTLNLE